MREREDSHACKAATATPIARRGMERSVAVALGSSAEPLASAGLARERDVQMAPGKARAGHCGIDESF